MEIEGEERKREGRKRQGGRERGKREKEIQGKKGGEQEKHMHEVTTNNHDNKNTKHQTDTKTNRHTCTCTHTRTHTCTRTHADTNICTCTQRKYVHTQSNSRTYEPAHLHTHERTHAHTTLMCGMRNEGVKEEQHRANTRARAHTAKKLQPLNVAKTQESEGDMKIAKSLPEWRLHAALAALACKQY